MRTALLLFAFGLLLRILFWVATPDRGAAWSFAFQGDAPVWQDLAQKLATGRPDELLALPLRPPGMLWLVAALWDGTGSGIVVRLCFAVLGALVAPLVFGLLRPHLPAAAAAGSALWCAASSNLIVLGSGPHVELPYLVLVLASLHDQERLRAGRGTWISARWGALHALATLLRAEHVLTFGLLWLLVLWQRKARRWPIGLAAAASFALCLLPWQLAAGRLVDAYNAANPPALPPAGVRAGGRPPWTADALARVRTLPAFQQGPAWAFVSDTVRVRGGGQVDAGDLDVLREAFGTWPEPIPRPFVCLYGGLNFFLGNSPEAAGGFSQQALDRPPPLAGGPRRYPPNLVLPRDGQLALSYPVHLDLLAHGYRHGLADLAADPAGGIGRIGKKLRIGLEGAVGGLGGFAVPIGLSGLRRPVDMVQAQGLWADAFRLLVLAVAAAGLWRLRRQPWLAAWLVFAATKFLVIGAFFGYARQGALCVPLVAVGVAAVALRWLGAGHRPWLGLGLLLLALEAVRALTVGVSVDLVPAAGPPAVADHRAHEVAFPFR